MPFEFVDCIGSGFYMAPGQFCRDETTGFDLNLCYSMSYLYKLKNDRLLSYSDLDEARDLKRLKQEESTSELLPGGASLCNNNKFGSNYSLPRLQFRDYVWAYAERYLAIEAMEEAAAAAALVGSEAEEEGKEVCGNSDGMKLVQQLVACAEAVACRDKAHASVLLSELNSKALVFGTSFQRVASCFVQGLSDRLALVQPLGAVGVVDGPSQKTNKYSAEKDETLHLVYEICPQIQFGHFVANAAILEALEGESSIHIVDLGMTLGLPEGQQWLQLMKTLANQPRKPPHRLRITGVGTSTERLQAIGAELELYASTLELDFTFSFVKNSLENLKPNDISLVKGEVVVINSILQMHCVVKESRGALNNVLQTLRELSPKLMILLEQDSSHNGPFFLGRFMEALHYYSAIFDSLEATLPKYDTRRAKIEHFFFAEEIKNIVSCEGAARVERHERVGQWRRRMSRARFQNAPVRMMKEAKQWLLSGGFCEGYTVTEEKGCLILGWKSKPIVAASCWKCY